MPREPTAPCGRLMQMHKFDIAALKKAYAG